MGGEQEGRNSEGDEIGLRYGTDGWEGEERGDLPG